MYLWSLGIIRLRFARLVLFDQTVCFNRAGAVGPQRLQKETMDLWFSQKGFQVCTCQPMRSAQTSSLGCPASCDRCDEEGGVGVGGIGGAGGASFCACPFRGLAGLLQTRSARYIYILYNKCGSTLQGLGVILISIAQDSPSRMSSTCFQSPQDKYVKAVPVFHIVIWSVCRQQTTINQR